MDLGPVVAKATLGKRDNPMCAHECVLLSMVRTI